MKEPKFHTSSFSNVYRERVHSGATLNTLYQRVEEADRELTRRRVEHYEEGNKWRCWISARNRNRQQPLASRGRHRVIVPYYLEFLSYHTTLYHTMSSPKQNLVSYLQRNQPYFGYDIRAAFHAAPSSSLE